MYSEYQLSPVKDYWRIKSGLYYVQFHSSFSQSFVREVDCNGNGLLISKYNLTNNVKYISHLFRIPAIFNFKVNKFSFSGGLLFDFELTNRESWKGELNPSDICIDDPHWQALAQGASFERKRNNSLMSIGPELGVGYTFIILGAEASPLIKYYFSLGFENGHFDDAKYAWHYHALGLGIKLYFK